MLSLFGVDTIIVIVKVIFIVHFLEETDSVNRTHNIWISH